MDGNVEEGKVEIDFFTDDVAMLNDLEYKPSRVLKKNKLHKTHKVTKTQEMGCVICQDDDDKDERYKADCCGNKYHHKCLVEWLIRKESCPSCRSVMMK